jgi:hypothetical protein
LGFRKSRVVLASVDLRMRPGPEACEVLGGVAVAFVTGIVFRSVICSLIFTSGPDFVTEVADFLLSTLRLVVSLGHIATLSQVEL